MQRVRCGAVVVVASLALAGGVHAQQAIQWKQTINTPKGLNLPRDVKVDILGIELGDTLDEVKAKLDGLLAEVAKPATPAAPMNAEEERLANMRRLQQRAAGSMSGAASASPLVESKAQMYMQVGSDRIVIDYVNGFALNRTMPGNSGQKYSDELQVTLSAPSSGRQTIGISRVLSYPNQSDQPRISDLIGRLSEKLKAKPQVFPQASSGTIYRFQFDDGRPFAPPKADENTCRPRYAQAGAKDTAQQSNPTNQCDVVMDIEVKFGISVDHAYSVLFTLSDNERTKANVVADFTFFETYIRDVQSRSQGTRPKL